MPFRFLDEMSTADVAFEAWGGDAGGAVHLQRRRPAAHHGGSAGAGGTAAGTFTIRLEHEELDLLLFSFLQELIFYKDARRLLLHADRVQIEQREGLLQPGGACQRRADRCRPAPPAGGCQGGHAAPLSGRVQGQSLESGRGAGCVGPFCGADKRCYLAC